MAVFAFLFSCRINDFLPPSPRPPSRREGGVPKLISPGLRPRHPCTEPPTALADAAVQVPGGGLPSRSPARPAFSFISFPQPPAPFPAGRGQGAGGLSFPFGEGGQKKQTKGRVGRRQRRKPPCPQFCPGSAAGNLYGGSYNAGSGLMPGAERQAPGNNFRK